MKWLPDDTTAWQFLLGMLRDPAGRKGLLGLTLTLGLLVWLLSLGALGVVHWWEIRQLPPPMTEATLTVAPTPPISGYEATAQELGLDARTYARSAQARGLRPAEALSADLIICAANDDCPSGVTQTAAKDMICQKTGKTC